MSRDQEVADIEHIFDDVEPKGSVIYMLRTTQQHHVQLSAMADQKASFLIAASFVMLTLLFRQIAIEGLSLSLMVLCVFTLSASLFAVIAVIPRAKMPKFDLKSCNPLFFGCFAQMSEDEYLLRMREAMETDGSVYKTMSRDIYQMGKVLHDKKFRYLGYSYRIFIIGLIMTLLSGIAEFYLM